MRVINLTPHPINLLDADNNIILELPISGLPIPRAKKINEKYGYVEIDGIKIPLVTPVFGQVDDLPDEAEDTFYIVSLIVQQARKDRKDLLIVEDVVRNGSTIKGCRAFGI